MDQYQKICKEIGYNYSERFSKAGARYYDNHNHMDVTAVNLVFDKKFLSCLFKYNKQKKLLQMHTLSIDLLLNSDNPINYIHNLIFKRND